MPNYYPRGVETIENAMQLKIQTLVNDCKKKEGMSGIGVLSWLSARISFEMDIGSEYKYIGLDYLVNDERITYEIEITTQQSNLGIGELYYFVCPWSGKRVKSLYLCYGSKYFKSRYAYHKPIFYKSQIQGKNYYNSHRKFKIERQLQALHDKGFKETYKGKPTRIAKYVEKLKQEFQYHEEKVERLLFGAMLKLWK